MEFPSPVPYRIGDQYFESRLRNPDGSVNLGLIQRSVHHLKEEEYFAIVQMGMAKPLSEVQNNEDGQPEPDSASGRRIIERIVSQPVRDKAFQEIVRSAYDATCAMTGLKLVNGGGKCEIEAAHIKPVGDMGPDSPRNGLALSRTFHWMFDRGILSLDNDGKILTAGKLITEPVRRMMNPDGYLRKPANRLLWPHKQFLRYHREHVFKG